MIPSVLAAAAPGWTTEADVVVIGSGIAGLVTALRCRPRSASNVTSAMASVSASSIPR